MDRLDITGARWGLAGAEAILKLRAIKANGDRARAETIAAVPRQQRPDRALSSAFLFCVLDLRKRPHARDAAFQRIASVCQAVGCGALASNASVSASWPPNGSSTGREAEELSRLGSQPAHPHDATALQAS